MQLAVTMSPRGGAGQAVATIRIDAARAVIWRLLTSCAEALNIVPGLQSCVVEQTAADSSWQIIRQVVEYSWILPRVSYVARVTYSKPNRIAFEETAGDLLKLHGFWDLQSDGEATIAHYEFEFEPGYWVPHWIVRFTLQRDLPKMLHALRARAEAVQQQRSKPEN